MVSCLQAYTGMPYILGTVLSVVLLRALLWKEQPQLGIAPLQS